MTDPKNTPDILPNDDDTAWPEHDDETRGQAERLDDLIDENTSLNGARTPPP